MIREILLGFVRVHVLHHAADEPFFGSWMMEELGSHGYDVGPGTLYPILHRMEEDGYLVSEERTEGGRVRRYYAATDLGREALAEARAKAAELTREVAPPGAPPSDD
jgi:DNA-binding PadR family transcriptional regulator